MATGWSSQADKSSEIAIFARLLEAEGGQMRRDLARYVLGLGFNDDDQRRMLDLAARNQDGALSLEEQRELQSYVKAGHLLALLHSKARMSLKPGKGS